MNDLFICFVLFTIHWQYGIATLNITEHSVHYSGKEVIFDHRSFTDENFVYAVCDENSDPQTLKCVVKRHNSIDSNDTYSCAINVKAKHEKGKLLRKFQIVPFAKDKVILIVAETIEGEQHNDEAFIEIKTMQLESCKINEVRFPVEAWFSDHMDPMLSTVVVPYEKSFDVFYPNTKQCSNKHCRVTIDEDGHVVKGPVKSIEICIARDLKEPVTPIQAHSPTKGLLFLDYEYLYPNDVFIDRIDLSILKSDGSKTSVESFEDLDVQGVVISTANNIIALCSKRSHITCLQYDSNYNLKLNIAHPEYNVRMTYLIGMYNVHDGGYLLLLGTRQKNKSEDSSRLIDRNMLLDLSLIRINEDGEKVGSIALTGPTCDMELHRYASLIEEKKGKEYCVYLACYTVPYISRSQDHLHTVMNCLSDDDFKKSE